MVGFPVAIAVTTLATLAGRAVGLVEDDMLDAAHPLTSFVSRPDAFSFVVAFLAGIVGMRSLTSAKSGALIGVLISVTTVPAAGYIGVAPALGEPGGAGGAVARPTPTIDARLDRPTSGRRGPPTSLVRAHEKADDHRRVARICRCHGGTQ